MMPYKLPKLMATRKHKNAPWRYFVRQKGQPRVRVHGKPGSPEFMANYRAAFTKEPGTAAPAQPVKHTWRWLCTRYMGSAEFKQLAKSTRSQRASVLEATWDEPLAPARRS
jgi:hypothetical protein